LRILRVGATGSGDIIWKEPLLVLRETVDDVLGVIGGDGREWK
jgi:hypothetical protein